MPARLFQQRGIVVIGLFFGEKSIDQHDIGIGQVKCFGSAVSGHKELGIVK
ncbi:hypothetical protein D9M71_794090 [compost metagenome]